MAEREESSVSRKRRVCEEEASPRGAEAVGLAMVGARRFRAAAGWIDAATRLTNSGRSAEYSESLLGASLAALDDGGDDPEARALETLALDKLALSLIRRGATREADALLRRNGVTHRYSDTVIREQGDVATALVDSLSEVSEAQGGIATCEFAFALDGCVPEPLLAHLEAAFAPSAAFWPAHRYDSAKTGYFSYVAPMRDCRGTLIGRLLRHLRGSLRHSRKPFAERALQRANVVEWWAHRKPADAGHELHFDADSNDGSRLPLASFAIVLSDAGGRGGPLLITNYFAPDGDEVFRNRGFASDCKRGRLACFDGRLLHGVAPGRPGPELRTTLMLSLWESLPASSSGDQPRAAMAMPTPRDVTAPPWARDLFVQDDDDDDEEEPEDHATKVCGIQREQPIDVKLRLIEPLWIDLAEDNHAYPGRKPLLAPPPPYSTFQGVTTWRALLGDSSSESQEEEAEEEDDDDDGESDDDDNKDS